MNFSVIKEKHTKQWRYLLDGTKRKKALLLWHCNQFHRCYARLLLQVSSKGVLLFCWCLLAKHTFQRPTRHHKRAASRDQSLRALPKGVLLFLIPFWLHLLVATQAVWLNSHTTLDLLLQLSSKGVLLFCRKRSTPFHKEILPTFTKQLRKNYTIILLLSCQEQCKCIY